MPALDIFNTSAFNMAAMSTAIMSLPHKPTKLGDKGLFTPKPINTKVAMIDSMQGKLSLVPNMPRDAQGGYAPPRSTRKVRTLAVPFFPQYDRLLAEEVIGVRAFGGESELETLTKKVEDRLQELKNNIEVTHEYQRAGALQGIVYDHDASTVIYNYFTEFGITEPTVVFDFSVATPAGNNCKAKAAEAIRGIEDSLGVQMYSGIEAMCGNAFWDALRNSPEVRDGMKWTTTGIVNPYNTPGVNVQRDGFLYEGIMWWNYRASIGSTKFIDTNQCRIYPTGVPDLFQEIYAPGTFAECVGTYGQKYYAKQTLDAKGIGVDLDVQSAVLFLPTRPGVLYKGTFTT